MVDVFSRGGGNEDAIRFDARVSSDFKWFFVSFFTRSFNIQRCYTLIRKPYLRNILSRVVLGDGGAGTMANCITGWCSIVPLFNFISVLY